MNNPDTNGAAKLLNTTRQHNYNGHELSYARVFHCRQWSNLHIDDGGVRNVARSLCRPTDREFITLAAATAAAATCRPIDDAPAASRRRRTQCSTCSMEQFAGHCHIVAIAADIQETTRDRTVCSQLSRLLAAAISDTCFFLFLSASLSRLFHVILFLYGVLEVFDIMPP